MTQKFGGHVDLKFLIGMQDRQQNTHHCSFRLKWSFLNSEEQEAAVSARHRNLLVRKSKLWVPKTGQLQLLCEPLLKKDGIDQTTPTNSELSKCWHNFVLWKLFLDIIVWLLAHHKIIVLFCVHHSSFHGKAVLSRWEWVLQWHINKESQLKRHWTLAPNFGPSP